MFRNLRDAKKIKQEEKLTDQYVKGFSIFYQRSELRKSSPPFSSFFFKQPVCLCLLHYCQSNSNLLILSFCFSFLGIGRALRWCRTFGGRNWRKQMTQNIVLSKNLGCRGNFLLDVLLFFSQLKACLYSFCLYFKRRPIVPTRSDCITFFRSAAALVIFVRSFLVISFQWETLSFPRAILTQMFDFQFHISIELSVFHISHYRTCFYWK